jgi:hypothetical protein
LADVATGDGPGDDLLLLHEALEKLEKKTNERRTW